MLCGLYSYGMLLLKEHNCIAVRQMSPPTRVQVCSLWVATLYSLKTTNPSPPTSQINYQQACSTSTLSTCSFYINTRILFFSLFAIHIFNQLHTALENITWEKKRVQKDFAFYCRTNSLSGVIHRPSPLGPPRRTFQVFADLFSYFL